MARRRHWPFCHEGRGDGSGDSSADVMWHMPLPQRVGRGSGLVVSQLHDVKLCVLLGHLVSVCLPCPGRSIHSGGSTLPTC